MLNAELIRSWKDPLARIGDMTDHPAGSIVVEGAICHGQRSRVLAGKYGQEPVTHTWTFVCRDGLDPDEDDWWDS